MKVTPFAHVGLVPAQPFWAGAAVVMVATGLLAAIAAVAVFNCRDPDRRVRPTRPSPQPTG